MIENPSDQILGYSQEIRDYVKFFKAEGYTFEESIQIVKLGIEAISLDIERRKLKD